MSGSHFAEEDMLYVFGRSDPRPTHLIYPRVYIKAKSPDTSKMITPYQKPAKLFATLLKNHSRPDDWVLDATGGSGSSRFSCT